MQLSSGLPLSLRFSTRSGFKMNIDAGTGGVPKLLPKPCIGREFADKHTSRNLGKNGQLKGNGRLTTPHFGTRNQVPGNRLRVRLPCPPLT